MIDEVDLEEYPNLLVTPPVSDGNSRKRLDKFLADTFPDVSRNAFIRLIEDNKVKVKSTGFFANHPDMKVEKGQVFEIDLPAPEPADVKPEDMPLDIVYEDDDVLVVNKPAGLVVHPGAGNWEHTLVNGLLFHCHDSLSGVGGVQRPGIVHRIDKDTSGLLVVAKNDKAHLSLAKQFEVHSIQREYQAFVWGKVEQEEGRIEGNIGRSSTNRQKMALVKTGGKSAVTHYKRLAVFGGGIVSHVKCVLETGRTHQIRVHMSSIHHPLVGDYTYGHPPKNAPDFVRDFPRQALHAGVLGFVHPTTGKQLVFEVPMPSDMQELKEKLEKL
ncbi:MAG: RluA family pseudouridine synthase [Alphaproteobacteria bacterium]|nr:RluA family pseudouridine synthase [Alphaproteobacteria bacterium]